MKSTKLPAIITLAIVGAAAVVFVLSGIRQRIAAEYWRARLDTASNDRVAAVIQQISDLDKAGIPVLAEALGSSREIVSLSAKLQLLARLDRWRMLPIDEYVSRSTLLAEALADCIERFPPAAQTDAVDLAEKILVRPINGGTIDPGKLLAASEKILRTAINANDEPSDLKLADLPDPTTLKIAALRKNKTEEINGRTADQRNSPGTTSSGDMQLQTADSQANSPRLLNHGQVSRPLALPNLPAKASRIPDRADIDSDGKPGRHTTAEPLRTLSHFGDDSADRPSFSSLAAMEPADLMRELHCDDTAKTAAIEAELARRGFSNVQLELGKRLFDPDPDVRKKLARELPGFSGVDAMPWLFQLSRDSAAEVRLAAISFLATSTDPAVLKEVEQIAQRDADENIRRIADRIEQQRNASR